MLKGGLGCGILALYALGCLAFLILVLWGINYVSGKL